MVWPKLRSVRRPASRSSLATTCGLDVARARDRLHQRRLVAGEQRRQARLDPGEERVVGDRAVLDDLGEAGDQLALGQRPRASTSATTASGWWKAPTMFLPDGWLTPVLPPTEESTWASSVVGTWT